MELADVKSELPPLAQILTQSESIFPTPALERLFTLKQIQSERFTKKCLIKEHSCEILAV
ncbi:MAG: hypothetical protein V7K47_03655 [Nostoc sp.]